ncbi:MAG: DUF1553 domain-containing protein [Acidobacteriia bacterium]|nr:DUF1553 domain-containing protein [Terriglobia bacterium]
MKRAGCATFWLASVLWGQNGRVDFDRQIRPIFSDNCYACHGPDDNNRKAGLRFDTREGAFRDGGNDKIIVPGDAASSRLYRRISDQSASRMPPPSSGHSLTADQIDSIRRWIDQGASWESHWAFVPPKRPVIPTVKDQKRVRNPVDAFVLKRLETEGLQPSPEADKATLLRRVSLDLTGLPPTPAELDSFEQDKSADAYEKQVDRLLHSPHYGERMAMQWLDLARYADSHGYHIDSHRDMWPWRDWVIRAFNRNMPFDQFTIEQIAGDLLPNATLEQRIATGFNRNHMINFEGGAIPEEYQLEYVVDRVDTTATTWLGLTLGCARCHDHKYDPITQKEFYSFAAFFNSVSEEGLDGMDGNAKPFLKLPTEQQRAEQERLTPQIVRLQAALPVALMSLKQLKWEKERTDSMPPPSTDGLAAHYEFDGSLADTSGQYQHGRVLKGSVAFTAGPVGRAAAFDGNTSVVLAKPGALEKTKPFSLALWLKPTATRETRILTYATAIELILEKAQVLPHLRQVSSLRLRLADSLVIRSRKSIQIGTWHAVAVTSDGSTKASAVRLYIDGQPAEIDVLEDSLPPAPAGGPLAIGDPASGNPYKGDLDDLRIYRRVLSTGEINQLAIQEPARATLALPIDKRSADQTRRLYDYFLSYQADGDIPKQYAELKDLNRRRDELEKSILTTMVMEEMNHPRDTHVLARGDYRNPGEKVYPGTPAVLGEWPQDAPRNRLGLAKWLVDERNPLAARVAVNHFWQMYFGLGLVKTSEDFGSQGDAPSDPALLDWLATEFVRTGWDIRALQKLIVTSATYRQTSRTTPQLQERDPENRLLARGPRFRMPAEMVRDNALAVSGLLNPQVGGPSVFPYQPAGLWEELAFGGAFSMQTYVQSKGPDLYRRSMYTFWKRTSPPASLTTFDAPNREKCTALRLVTNTPLQALVLENDPTYVEAARVLAQRAIREAGGSVDKRIAFAFRLATARRPTQQEQAILSKLQAAELARYTEHPSDARKVTSVGEFPVPAGQDLAELAAWTSVASVILNLDETITKE